MMTFDDFKAAYFLHLGAADHPRACDAYESAEADHLALFGVRRFKSWAVFRAASSHRSRRQRQRKLHAAEALANT